MVTSDQAFATKATRLVIFGSGDLTKRYLLPAVAELIAADALRDDLTIEVVGRRELSTEEFRQQLGEALEGIEPEPRRQLLEQLEYRQGDGSEPDDVLNVVGSGDRPVVAYLALPPSVFPAAVRALAAADLPQGSRVVVEKPFGSDAESAAALNDLLLDAVPAQDGFRVDHFLGTQTAHDILTLRFANSVFEPLWSNRNVASVEIVWDEELALEGRAGYYDGNGAARDMIQNHLLQLLCLVAMEPPEALTSEALADRKVDVLRAARPWDASAASCSVRARYTAGSIGDREVPSYVDEEGVEPEAGTETYAQITFAVDTPRWAGVPFVLRSGKALSRGRHEVAVHFTPVPPVDFCPDAPQPNVLRFQVEPDRVTLDATLTAGEGMFALAPMQLASKPSEPELSAYASVLADVLEGDNVLSVRGDEAVEAWRVVQPVLDAWERDDVPLLEYEAGSNGPSI